jgi:hypothetical protein
MYCNPTPNPPRISLNTSEENAPKNLILGAFFGKIIRVILSRNRKYNYA